MQSHLHCDVVNGIDGLYQLVKLSQVAFAPLLQLFKGLGEFGILGSDRFFIF